MSSLRKKLRKAVKFIAPIAIGGIVGKAVLGAKASGSIFAARNVGAGVGTIASLPVKAAQEIGQFTRGVGQGFKEMVSGVAGASKKLPYGEATADIPDSDRGTDLTPNPPDPGKNKSPVPGSVPEGGEGGGATGEQKDNSGLLVLAILGLLAFV